MAPTWSSGTASACTTSRARRISRCSRSSPPASHFTRKGSSPRTRRSTSRRPAARRAAASAEAGGGGARPRPGTQITACSALRAVGYRPKLAYPGKSRGPDGAPSLAAVTPQPRFRTISTPCREAGFTILMPDPIPDAPDREFRPTEAFLAGGGQMGARLRARDWSATPLGPAAAWPAPLKTLVAVMLGARQPMFVAWGPERIMLYNDDYATLCGARHPAALGRTFREVWFDILDDVEPILERAFAGEGTHMDDIALLMHRNGYPEETYFSFSYTPVRDEDGTVCGMFCACSETTGRVQAEHRQEFRLALEEQLRGLAEPHQVMAAAAAALAG